MPYIQFQYKCGDQVYVGRYVRNATCHLPAYILLTVKTFFRKDNANYYRLSDGKVFDEKSLLDIGTYKMLLAWDKEQLRQCIEQRLANL
jgi:hypothetical protein